jgi:hypothetical protein
VFVHFSRLPEAVVPGIIPPNTLKAIPLTSNEAPKSGLRTTKNLLPMWYAPQTIKTGIWYYYNRED